MENVHFIGVDHGNSEIKTVNTRFKNRIEPLFKKSTEESLSSEPQLQFNGEFYEAKPYRSIRVDDRTEDDNFYLLTLVAIAKELDLRVDYDESTVHEIFLGVGLPPNLYEFNRDKFKDYMLKYGRNLVFDYGDNTHKIRSYQIEIKDVYVYPQGAAAVLGTNYVKSKTNSDISIVDIGSFTVDIVDIKNKRLQTSDARSLRKGTISFMNDSKSEVEEQLQVQLEDSHIEELFINGQPDNMNNNVANHLHKKRLQYATDLFRELNEKGVNFQMNKIVFLGGGTSFLKPALEEVVDDFFAKNENLIKNVEYYDNIQANAKGYEFLTEQMAKKRSMSRS